VVSCNAGGRSRRRKKEKKKKETLKDFDRKSPNLLMNRQKPVSLLQGQGVFRWTLVGSAVIFFGLTEACLVCCRELSLQKFSWLHNDNINSTRSIILPMNLKTLVLRKQTL